MFEDPELPDFDSMSQEELIAWLEQLAKRQTDAASEFIDDYADDLDDEETDTLTDLPQDEEWSDWLENDDDVPPGSQPPIAVASLTLGDDLPAADDDTPVDLTLFEEGESAGDTAEMDWLEKIATENAEEKLPEISDYRPPETQPRNLDELIDAKSDDDPLDWLEKLESGAGFAAASSPANADRQDADAHDDDIDDEIDDAYEDDEMLDDLEDESLYSRIDNSLTFLEALLGMEDSEAEKHSTQSMAPVPDYLAPAAEDATEPELPETTQVARAEAVAERSDSLTQAFLLQDQREDLEAWYMGRLKAITTPGRRALQSQTAPEPPPAKPPPPGLAAAINSARGKVAADQLEEALLDYETLLRTNAGLEWVVSDMRAMLAQDKLKDNPSVHRVLGDALMRQGHLPAALDIYRHALSLL